MKPGNKNSFKSKSRIKINGSEYTYYSIQEAEKNGLDGVSKLPKSLKVLLENLLRYEDDLTVNESQILAIKLTMISWHGLLMIPNRKIIYLQY